MAVLKQKQLIKLSILNTTGDFSQAVPCCLFCELADINECISGEHNCTSKGLAPAAECVNLLHGRGYECSCDHLVGYQLNLMDYATCEGTMKQLLDGQKIMKES